MFPLNLTSKLTGVTPNQLRLWSRSGLLVPEIRAKRPPIYSFRDLVALRSIAFLRSETSLQKIHKAFGTLNVLHMVEHPSEYSFGTDGKTIFVQGPDAEAINLVRSPGARTLFTFEEMNKAFINFRKQEVPSFTAPAPHICVDPARIGGWPAIEGTRIGYDVIADLAGTQNPDVEYVLEYYPDLTASAVESAIEFNRQIEAIA